MNKKGFTLVEILSIIAVLGVMVLLIFPNIGGSTEDKKEKELQKIIGIVENAGKSYFSFNNDEYKKNAVIYDDLYTITDVNTDETIKPTSFQYVQIDNSFATINNNYVQVNEDGNYLIALKVNMDIHEGAETKMMMSFFLNDDRINETTCSLYLNPANKAYPLGFLAGQVQIQLKSSDKLYLKARWTNKANIENHCTLQITKLS